MAVKNSGIVKSIALERMELLYALAKEAYKDDPELSERYVRLIGQISRHYRVKPSIEVKRHICRKCGSLLVPGASLSVRIASSKRRIIYRCTICGAEKKIIY
ncbi:MAG: ribonuclease P [Candidatus Micrarchaeota archaeon]|nr:ribonuclease P [Candidatus Micrarchaeota archaeon]